MEKPRDFINDKAQAVREKIFGAISEDLDRGDGIIDVARCDKRKAVSTRSDLHAFKLLKRGGVSS